MIKTVIFLVKAHYHFINLNFAQRQKIMTDSLNHPSSYLRRPYNMYRYRFNTKQACQFHSICKC